MALAKNGGITARRELVSTLLQEGAEFDANLRRELAEKFGCTSSAISADVVALTRPETKETAHTTAAMRAAIRRRDGECCQYCSDTNAYEYIVEHVIPAAIGGVAKEYNLVIACQRCNVAKGRQVWLPRNFNEITRGHPRWREKVLGLVLENET